MNQRSSLTVLVFLLAFARPLPAQDRMLITEFMAANGGTLLDEDGDSSDWLELYNAGTNTVNLGGWHLTDDAANLTQWTLPSTNLAPGRFLLVFASGKNRAVAGLPLHTDFQLNSAGEYLGLIKPDGLTIAHEYAPAYPPQIDGVSYGVELNLTTTTFLTNGAAVKWSVPAGPAGLPAAWMATNFDDLAWSGGWTGVGFDAGLTNSLPPGTATNLALGKPTSQSSTNGSYVPSLAVDGNYANFTHTLAGVNLPATWEVNLGTNYGLQRIVLWNRTSNRSRLRDITVRILDASGSATNFTSALLNPENVLGGGVINVGPTNLSLDLAQLTGGLVLGGRVRVTRTPDPDASGTGGQTSTSEQDVLSLAEVEVFGAPVSTSFAGSLRTDILGSMRNVNASALLRIPFTIPVGEMPQLDLLTLRLQYDDGFVAYLNGVEVARRNAPATLAWNSAATAEHPDSAAIQFEDIDLSPFLGSLQEGMNVLAIQGLNLTAGDDDFLVLPQLNGQSIQMTPGRYFAQPTPGAANAAAYLGLVADTKFSVDRGLFDTPFSLSITTATPTAEIRYTTNGTTPSAVNGFVYTGPLLVDHTVVVRALATKPGWQPSDVDTHTYVFLGNVATQNLQSAVSAGFPAAWTGTTPDYDMNPNIVATNVTQVQTALRSLPSVFITTTISNLFDPATGIYVNPLQHGVAWERASSLEMVGTNGQSEFQAGCGLRIQGGAFRGFNYTQKKSLRILFKSEYGTGKLHYDLFDDRTAAQDFDTLVLRAGGNDGYAWGSAGTTVQFIRDEFGRRLLLDMGHPSARGLFVHLYLNGLYWGLYNLAERPNEDFSASYLGGAAEDWDSFTSKGNLKNGNLLAWNSFSNQVSVLATYADYQKLQGNNPDGARNPSYPVLYDKLDYMDYMLLNIWGGNWDWPGNNFWVGYNRNADGTGLKFYEWDFENTLGNNLSRSPLAAVVPRVDGSGNERAWVGAPHYFLKNFSEYKIDFADRVQKYFFNGGLLTPQALTNRYRQLADSLQPALVAESARWGDDNHTPAYGLPEWLGERDWILTNYLPQRTAIVWQQFVASGLYPHTGPPLFSPFGGAVPADFALGITHTNASGGVFYTLDGSDPRVPGSGTVAPAAQAYSVPITFNGPTLVRARVFSGVEWSALVEAVFYPPQDLSRLAVTELMDNPPKFGSTSGDELEFLELKNFGTKTLDLSGLTFTAGISFTFTNGTLLGPGQFYLLARNRTAMAAKYPGVVVNGLYTGKLDNSGETVTLSHPVNGTVFSLKYDVQAPWPVAAAGLGYSMVPKNPGLSQAPDDGAKWRASAQIGGSPGADDPDPGIPGIVINEILAHTDLPQYDAIELYNPTVFDADISGWYLTDDPAVPRKYRLPDGTRLPSDGLVYFDARQFDPTPGANNSFGLAATGDDVYLFSANPNGELTGYSHGVVFGASFNGVSFGRVVDSAGQEHFPQQTALTLGAPNSGPRVGPVVINEIHYHPVFSGDEFIELLNITSNSVPLFDPAHSTNAWKLKGISFSFPTNIVLAPAGLVLLVATNPADFRARFSVPTNVPIFGPYAGVLQHGGELLELQAPDNPDTNMVPYVTVEDVGYNQKSPWPPAADGGGLSLQRLNPCAYGNEPANWIAAGPTPGRLYETADTDGDGMPDVWEIAHGTSWNTPDADADPDGDGMSNLQEYLAGTDPYSPDSCLKFSHVTATPGRVALEFLAQSNHTYSVFFSPVVNSSAWNKLADVPARATNHLETITDVSPTDRMRFYRLVTPAHL